MYAGFDTSNYTTSVAAYENGIITQAKKMLSVKPGERGLRQSDAVFQHTVNMPELLNELNFDKVEAVGVSTRPRNIDGSYMPCFLVGEGIAEAFAKGCNAQLYKTSHQVGHIIAALYSCNMLELLDKTFIAFHLSGGTTEAVLVKPDKDELIKAKLIARSLDLKAGQAIDRAGVMMGLQFPCGKELDRLSQKSSREYKINPSMKGPHCSLSGVENKAKSMLSAGKSKEDISKFVLSSISSAIDKMLYEILKEYGDLPVLFSGGVSSNTLLRNTIQNKYSAYFATPEFSLDNAAGVAVYAKIKHN